MNDHKQTQEHGHRFAVYSATGVQIGLWSDGKTAAEFLAEYHPGGYIEELVLFSESLSAQAAILSDSLAAQTALLSKSLAEKAALLEKAIEIAQIYQGDHGLHANPEWSDEYTQAWDTGGADHAAAIESALRAIAEGDKE